VPQRPEAWGWAAATGVLWGLMCFWRRLQATPASAWPRGEHRLVHKLPPHPETTSKFDPAFDELSYRVVDSSHAL
jgi:hypothetical protein